MTMQNFNENVKIENRRLKNEFRKLGLKPEDVLEKTPFNPELENRQLENLLDFVLAYLKCESREVMRLTNRPFPPIFPFISPESDWYRFERWMKGLSVRETIKNQLPKDFVVRPLNSIPEEELPKVLSGLMNTLNQNGFSVSLPKMPDRLIYNFVTEWLNEETELCPTGSWVFSGCSGYCPGCIQRPWCNIGQDCCWTEDEVAGKMVFPKEAELYVSASPVSLALLKKAQEHEDREFEVFCNRKTSGNTIELDDFFPLIKN